MRGKFLVSLCRASLVVGGGAVVLSALLLVPGASAENNGLINQVIPREQVAYGRTYADWTAAWWQWAFSIPLASNPLFDNGPCTIGQSGPVFFMGGSFTTPIVTRNCTVPAGKALFFPILNQEESVDEEKVNPFVPGSPALTVNALHALLEPTFDIATDLQVDLDGKSLKDLQPFRIQSMPFGFTIPEDDILERFGTHLAAGTYFPGVGDGFYVMIQPQPPGSHALHFHGTIPGTFPFTLDVTYHLTVSP